MTTSPRLINELERELKGFLIAIFARHPPSINEFAVVYFSHFLKYTAENPYLNEDELHKKYYLTRVTSMPTSLPEMKTVALQTSVGVESPLASTVATVSIQFPSVHGGIVSDDYSSTPRPSEVTAASQFLSVHHLSLHSVHATNPSLPSEENVKQAILDSVLLRKTESSTLVLKTTKEETEVNKLQESLGTYEVPLEETVTKAEQDLSRPSVAEPVATAVVPSLSYNVQETELDITPNKTEVPLVEAVSEARHEQQKFSVEHVSASIVKSVLDTVLSQETKHSEVLLLNAEPEAELTTGVHSQSPSTTYEIPLPVPSVRAVDHETSDKSDQVPQPDETEEYLSKYTVEEQDEQNNFSKESASPEAKLVHHHFVSDTSGHISPVPRNQTLYHQVEVTVDVEYLTKSQVSAATQHAKESRKLRQVSQPLYCDYEDVSAEVTLLPNTTQSQPGLARKFNLPSVSVYQEMPSEECGSQSTFSAPRHILQDCEPKDITTQKQESSSAIHSHAGTSQDQTTVKTSYSPRPHTGSRRKHRSCMSNCHHVEDSPVTHSSQVTSCCHVQDVGKECHHSFISTTIVVNPKSPVQQMPALHNSDGFSSQESAEETPINIRVPLEEEEN
ncbi:mucin-3A-like isoform X2 [Protopterus annectens]|uniref:mucin-3A-like isoform X2 n=1 Tax=Protopterus annectens TaxID=7888 RepID=UPI001CFB1898|nr:mucin-3A-like isoform X2 [Protopterus annectens]XP_043924889.1 mucin-3A-like isoform X2 [Protopterus annectens]